MKKSKSVRSHDIVSRIPHSPNAIANAIRDASAARPKVAVQPALQENLGAVPQVTHFKMRVECSNDGDLLYEVLEPYVTYWDARRQTFRHAGKEYQDISVEIGFGIRAGTLTLADIRSVFRHMADCHFAEETVALAQDYTGERVPLEQTDTLLGAPSEELLEPMIRRVDAAREFLRVQVRRVERASTVLKQMAETGALPVLDKAGTVAIVTHTLTGLSSVRRISGWPTEGEDPVQDRLLLLAH